MISVGFGSKKATLARALGWEPESWGYHADDGKGYNGQNVGRTFSANFSQSDVIGCGVNFRTRNAFFTKNGVNLGKSHGTPPSTVLVCSCLYPGVAFHNIPTDQKLYPAVSLKNQGEHISVNFGQTPFVYNIDDMMKASLLLLIHSASVIESINGRNRMKELKSSGKSMTPTRPSLSLT